MRKYVNFGAEIARKYGPTPIISLFPIWPTYCLNTIYAYAQTSYQAGALL
uniref:Uncharacterized protein n=1 Tax=Yersinia enterocolitica W22703 TaxID=913028 RepID=F4N6I6_YEREN|nr:unknown protein [Yersinia enterocolitica W22703]